MEIVRVEEMSNASLILLLKVQYDGDFSMTLKTKAQINPLYASQDPQDDPEETSLRHCSSQAGENRPFIVPVQLSVSQVEFDANVLVKMNLQKGFIEMGYCDFKNGVAVEQKAEPFFQLAVNSTFDDVPVIKKYLHSLVEEKIKQFLHIDLPELVHSLSVEKMRPIDVDGWLQHLFSNEEPDLGEARSSDNVHSVDCNNAQSLPEGSLLASAGQRGWSFDRDAFLSACYASPEGLFVVERRLLAPLTAPVEIQQRVAQIQSEGAASIQTNRPVVISFPFKSSMCHILSSFNSSLLFHKYSNSLFPNAPKSLTSSLQH